MFMVLLVFCFTAAKDDMSIFNGWNDKYYTTHYTRIIIMQVHFRRTIFIVEQKQYYPRYLHI